MDSKEEMTLSQKIVTDAVLKMDDYKKLEWLSRRYKEQGKIDQSFEKIFSSIPSTEELLIKKTKLLANLDIENSDIVEEIQSLITTVDVAKKYNILFDMIKYVKNSTQRLNLIKAVDSRMSSSNGFMYNLEETKDYCYALSETVATFKKPEEIVQFLNLNVLNPKVIASVISGMIPFMTDLEVISKYPEISKTINIDIKKWDAIYETEDDIINEIGTSLNVDLAIEQLKETLKIEDEFDDEFDIDEFLMYFIIDILPEEVRPVAMKDLYATINESEMREMRERLNGINQYLPAATAEILNKLISPLTKYTIPDIVEKEYRRLLFPTLSRYSLTEEGLIKTLVEKKINLNLLRLDSELKDANNERIDVEKLVSYFNSREDAITTIITYASFQKRHDAPHLLDLSNAKENMYQFIYNNIVRSSMSIDEIKTLPEEFKQAHYDLKKLCSLPSDLEEILHRRNRGKYDEELLGHSELIKILADSNINLKFIFPALSGDIEKISNQFDSREDAIKAISVYCWALYIQRIGDREIPQIDFEKENSKEEIYQKIYAAFSRGGCPYIESMPEDFKREYSNLFLTGIMPEELKTLIYKKSLNRNLLFDHPEWLDILANQKLDLNLLENSIFNKNGIKVDSNEFVNKFKNKKAGLFVLLNYKEMNNYYCKINPDETKPEVMVASAIKYNLHMPLFSTPFPFTDLLTDEVLESMLGFKDKQGKPIDVKRVVNEFGSREEIAKICAVYERMFRSNIYGRIDPDNIKESIYQGMYEFIINGKGYSEDMPEDFKKEHSDLFLSQDAPEKLRTSFYYTKNNRYNNGTNMYNYAAIYQNPEWIDILVKENINLNVLFQLYDTEYKRIDANILAEQFESREDAIRTFATYFSIMKTVKNIDPATPKESIYQSIYEFIINGGEYSEYMPEDFKKEHPDLFLSQDAPVGLKFLLYRESKKKRLQVLNQNTEWIDILAKENINLNVLFSFWSQNGNNIDAENIATLFNSRKEAIRVMIVVDGAQIEPNDSKEDIYEKAYKFIQSGNYYSEYMPEDFKKEHPDLFLSQDAPEELKNYFYYSSNKIGLIRGLLQHPEWLDVLTEEKIDINLIFKLKDVNSNPIDIETIINDFENRKVALNVLIVYSNIKNSSTILHTENFKEEMYFEIYEGILNGTKYSEDMPEDFKKEHPELFLDKTIPEDIRTKFYQKQFTLKDFEENPNLIRTFGNTNLLLGLNDNKYQFLITLFKGPDANNDRLKAIEIFNESTNEEEAEFIRNSIIESREAIGTIKIEKFPDLIELHKNVQYSNAVELSSFKENYMREILNSDNPSATFKSLENIYLKGDLPGYMKLFKCFKTIYPNFEKGNCFDFSPNSRISPELLEAGDAEHRFLIIYNDLLRTAVHSQDRTLIEYLNNINEGSELYFALNSGEKTIESISNEEVDKLTTFAGHLEALYKSISFPYQEELTENAYKKDELTQKFKILERISAKDYFKDINGLVPLVEVEKYKRAMLKTKISLLSKKFNASTISTPDELKDKIVSYIGHSAGYDSFNQIVQDINRIRNNADKRNRECAEEYRDKPFMFEEGDFLRGIGYIEALTGSLNKGNVAREFMCSYAGTSGSDATPLDVDISYVVPKSGITTSIDNTVTRWSYGNIFVVIKKDNQNFNITRDKDRNVLDTKYDPNKVEMFSTLTADHWGARTGISFTDVDFILYKENKIIERDERGLPMVDEKGNIVYVKNSNDRSDDGYVPIEHDALAEIQFEIARNGYYIPVIDMLGRLAFTPEQYDALRSKVAGLPYYSSAEYTISSKLDFPGIDELVEIKKVDMQKTAEKEKIVRGKVEEIIKNSKLDVDTIAIADTLSKDLTEGIVQLIGTGSTSRGTNVPDDSDFDYMLKVDKKVYMHMTDTLIANFKTMEHEEDNSHDKRVRLAGVTVEGLEEPFDIDISIDQKKNNIQYSTEMALEERLKTIRKQSPDDYYKVIANIVYAKQFLKEIGVYKSARVNPELGGLGGVGVENWILQNGGSFRQACETFLEKAFDPKTSEMVPFSDFKKVYTVWDFGENHESKGKHPFDEYVSLNMNEAGYTKLCVELPKKLKEINEGLSKNRTIESTTPIIEEEIIEEEPLEASVGFGR